MSVTETITAGRRLAACLGLFGATLVWLVCPTPIERDDAKERAAAFLSTPARSSSLSLDGRRWTVQGDVECVVLDAQTGALIETARTCRTPQP
jgi:hypothetical protein